MQRNKLQFGSSVAHGRMHKAGAIDGVGECVIEYELTVHGNEGTPDHLLDVGVLLIERKHSSGIDRHHEYISLMMSDLCSTCGHRSGRSDDNRGRSSDGDKRRGWDDRRGML